MSDAKVSESLRSATQVRMVKTAWVQLPSFAIFSYIPTFSSDAHHTRARNATINAATAAGGTRDTGCRTCEESIRNRVLAWSFVSRIICLGRHSRRQRRRTHARLGMTRTARVLESVQRCESHRKRNVAYEALCSGDVRLQ